MSNKLQKMIDEYDSTYIYPDIEFDPPDYELIDEKLIVKLKAIYNTMKDGNCDWWIAITGVEGLGKTTLATAILWEWCKITGLDFNDAIRDNIAFDEMDTLRMLEKFNENRVKKTRMHYYPWWYDEGAGAFFNRESMTGIRMIFIKWANAMRYQRRLVIICSTEFKQLDIYLREHRIKTLLRIERRGIYHYYNNEQLNKMTFFNQGKRDIHVNWGAIQPDHFGQFRYCPSLDKIIIGLKDRYFDRLAMEVKTLRIKKLIEKLGMRRAITELEKEEDEPDKSVTTN